VELTEAGEAFYEDACKILALSDAALEKARGIARGLNGNLSIGITSSDAFHPKIFTLIRQFQCRTWRCRFTRWKPMSSLTTMLAEGELDIAFVRLPCESSKAFELKILDREPMVVALHRDHPLAACDSLALEQLRDTPVVLFPQEVAPGLYDRVHGCCERAGIVQHALQSSQLSSSLSMVSAGGGFALVPKSMAAISPPNVTYHALSSPELYTDIALCWRRFERSRTVKRFLAMMSEGRPVWLVVL
jgi:DNA-binding transcriptional LysR family regulator